MDAQRTILAVFAHPDDETLVGGTLAFYASQGARVVLLTATRGEAGTIFNPALATPENIAIVRENELRCSCLTLGIEPPRFLDCGDGAVRRCSDAAVGEIVRVIREERPQAVITFGPEGLYGHPDHVAVHEVTTRAWHLAGDPAAFPEQLREGLHPYTPARLFYSQFTEDMVEVWGRYSDLTIDLNGEKLRLTGVPREKIDISLDIRAFLPQKHAAYSCHGSQIGEDTPLESSQSQDLDFVMGTEHFVLADGIPLPGVEGLSDLLAGL